MKIINYTLLQALFPSVICQLPSVNLIATWYELYLTYTEVILILY